MTHTPPQLHRAAGVLLGAAAGDALGAGYEFTYPRPDQTIGMIGGGLGGFEPGEWTDDTAMTVAVAEVTATGTDVRTAAGLDAVAAQLRPLVRLAPQGHRCADQQGAAPARHHRRGHGRDRSRVARPQGWQRLAHAHRCDRACVPRGSGCHRGGRIGGQRADPRRRPCPPGLPAVVAAHRAHGTDRRDRHGLDGASSTWTRRPPSSGCRSSRSRKPAPRRTSPTTAGWCTPCRPRGGRSTAPTTPTRPSCRSPWNGRCGPGHDTDTTAAIAGALLGARWGASAVPAAWRRILHGWPGLRSDDLIRLALQTYTGSDDPDPLARSRSGWTTAAGRSTTALAPAR